MTPVSSTYKTDRHDITEILLKVALNIISQTIHKIFFFFWSQSVIKDCWLLLQGLYFNICPRIRSYKLKYLIHPKMYIHVTDHLVICYNLPYSYGYEILQTWMNPKNDHWLFLFTKIVFCCVFKIPIWPPLQDIFKVKFDTIGKIFLKKCSDTIRLNHLLANITEMYLIIWSTTTIKSLSDPMVKFWNIFF